jgi:hypothetical protein
VQTTVGCSFREKHAVVARVGCSLDHGEDATTMKLGEIDWFEYREGK